MKQIDKLYAAYRSGCLGDDRLESYYPFFAKIILDSQWRVVEEQKVEMKFAELYGFNLPLTFVRQVLGVGIENGSIVNSCGQYLVNRDKMSKYKVDSKVFNKKWQQLTSGFRYYCKKCDIEICDIDIENEILNHLDENDGDVVMGSFALQQDETSKFTYAWNNYIKELATTNIELFDFYVQLSLCNIFKQAIFLCEDYKVDYKELEIYIDSPIVFALLGMDSDARVSSCKMLIKEARAAGCSVYVLDNNFQEAKGIVSRASSWARSDEYDISIANKVAMFLHDSDLDDIEIFGYCETIEEKLNNEFEVTVKKTDYDVYGHEFQEDEAKIFDLIKKEYVRRGEYLSEDTERSIRVDVRSIVMVYRERRGQVATTIHEAGKIMITLNSAIAKASKEYENSKCMAGEHIPACITADLFGAILWLSRPATLHEYKKFDLLADCYNALQPDKRIMKRYVESLVAARDAGDIDQKKFIFLRSHPLVREALFSITKGDYNKFTQRTYTEVYEEIESRAEEKYREEHREHIETQKKLTEIEAEQEKDRQKYKEIKTELEDFINKDKKRRKAEIAKKSNLRAWIIAAVVFGIPTILLVGAIEIYKSTFTDLKIIYILYVGVLVVISSLAIVVFKCIKKVINKNIERKLLDKENLN